jgi:hypothetical protein
MLEATQFMESSLSQSASASMVQHQYINRNYAAFVALPDGGVETL